LRNSLSHVVLVLDGHAIGAALEETAVHDLHIQIV